MPQCRTSLLALATMVRGARGATAVAAAAASVAVVLLASCATADDGSRDDVSFDFGWLHRTGLNESAGPDDQPPPIQDILAYLGQNGNEPPESTVAFDASAWKEVQLPHDGLIGAAPSQTACPHGCSGQSFIPRHTLWCVRK